MTLTKRLEVLDALADMVGVDRDKSVNDAIFDWAQGRVDGTMEKRLKESLSGMQGKSLNRAY